MMESAEQPHCITPLALMHDGPTSEKVGSLTIYDDGPRDFSTKADIYAHKTRHITQAICKCNAYSTAQYLASFRI